MELKISNYVITINGNISSVSDFEKIKDNIEQLRTQYDKITLRIHDSLVINSSLIGYLVKIVKQDGMKVNLLAGNNILYELLDDLALSEILNLQKV